MESLLLVPQAVALAVQPLTGVGLEPVIFKGPVVADRYPEPGLRPMEDIDLLLPPEAHHDALAVLERAGWKIARPPGVGVYDTVLSHPEVPSLYLELHYGLEEGSGRVTMLNPRALWMRRRAIECAETPAYGLALADEVVVLACHAGKPHHRFARLIWITDLAVLADTEDRAGTGVDWQAVHDLAKGARCLTVVGAALSMAGRAGLEMPTELFHLPSHGLRGATMSCLMSETWPLTQSELRAYRINYALVDRVLQRMQILLVVLATRYGLQRFVSRPYPPWRADLIMASEPEEARTVRATPEL
jgi:hypothetical protein